MTNFEYCAAIRTLGTAGEKYLSTLKSLQNQTIPPKKILVYIAKGYPLPKETIGTEQYIYVNKGMVAQRALPYDEVDTDYILCLDDDLSFPPDMVEKLYNSLKKYDADCIAPNTFPNHTGSIKWKITAAFGAFVFPMKSDKWAFRIRKSGAYSYNNYPVKDVYFSQSAAFNCFLCNISAYKAIHYEDELWLDKFKYALGDDQLFYYKLYINSYKLLVHYNTGIIHLNAKSGHITNLKERIYNTSQIDYIIWHRVCYRPNIDRGGNKLNTKIIYQLAYCSKAITKALFQCGYGVFTRQFSLPIQFLKGIIAGRKFTKTKEYQQFPDFKLRK